MLMRIGSQDASPKLKETYDLIQTWIVKFEPCVINIDIVCLKSVFTEIALPLKKKLIEYSTGAEKKLYEKMFTVDYDTNSKIQQLAPTDTEEAKPILCDMFKTKWGFVTEYMEEFPSVL